MAQVDSENSTAAPTDPIYGAIEAHRKAYAEFDASACRDAHADEWEAAFRALDRSCRQLVLAEASTVHGLIALLRYMAPLLLEDASPGLPLEIYHDSKWEPAFAAFCTTVADRMTAIVAAQSTPQGIDRVADAIVDATAPLIDDYETARRAARAAIEAITS